MRYGDASGAIESTIATGPSSGTSAPSVEEPGLLRQLSLERPHEALADLNAAPRQEPHLALGLLVPEKQDAALPAQDGRDANPRLGHRCQLDDDPNPRAPRSLTGELLDLDHPNGGDRGNDELGDAHPGIHDERLVAVGVDEHDLDLAPVARVDEPGRVHDADAVACGEPRSRLYEPRVSLGDLDGDPGRHHRALARLEHDALAGREIESGVALVGLMRQMCVLAETPDGDIDHRAEASSRPCSPATR